MFATVFTKSTWDRWKGMAIAIVSLALLLWMAMAVYRDIDLSVYTSLPEAFRSIIGIPEGADAASLGISVLYGVYGAMTLAALSISMGSGSIAGEERDGTLGLLLGNPKSRTHILVSKAASMVLLTGLGAVALFASAIVVPAALDVSITGLHVGAYSLHLYAIALFFGFFALAVGGWTGKRGLASGSSAGLMIISYLAFGIFPLIDGWESGAKAFPWYYFDGSKPVINGIDWVHIAVLLAGSAVLAVLAWIGVNRRDLRDQNVGVTLLDRLRSHPLTKKVIERLAGSARVSGIWIKTASEYQGMLIVTAYVMFLVMGILMGPLYAAIDTTLFQYVDDLPEALMAFAGAAGGDMATPEGFYQVETFGLMAPIAVMVVAVAIGAGGLGGEEARRTMSLLMANPIKRSKVVVEKAVAMAIHAFIVGLATFAGVWIGSVLGGLGMSVGNIAATSALASLLGLAFGAFALAVGAATGRAKVAAYAAIGAALAFHVYTSIIGLNDNLASLAKWSPFHYYLSSDPLTNGMPWGDGALLAALSVLLVGVAVFLFDRRDLRQSG